MPSAVGAEFTWTTKVWPICQLGISNVRLGEPTTWEDVSCHIHEAELFRGRERFNDRFQPGTATVTFSNDGGWGDLKASPAHVAESRLRPGRQIRLGVQGRFEDDPATVRTRWLWYGYIDQVTPAYEPTAHDVVTISCIDALGEAGSIATPEGPMVGVNETVTQRINRALNAVEWWPGKRSIASSSTLVQGTKQGSPAIDMMSVAADSAGGVVFGDTDGRIVFRDLNWELYDPSHPHDGEIGDCTPGTPPIPGEPPYVDPTPGPVYDPCPPIPHPPECVDICAEPGEGTIVEQGDSWRIYMHNHHLFYESAGHVWDMGVWDPAVQCVRICHPPPPPPPPPNGPPPPPPPPTRCDNPPCDPTIPPTDGIPVPYPFEVTFLGYTDGGIDDGPQDHITIAGIKPGKDALLVVLINALNGEDTGSLTPFPVAGGSIVMGTTVFQEMGIREPSGLQGAETYGAFIDIGRTDPGTVDITITWVPGNHSRQHVATAWRVQKARADMKQRMGLGAYLHASTWDRPPTAPQPAPPEPNPPGKGFTRVQQYSADTIGTQLDALTRWTDITIAQSMAESPNPPFGATFAEIDITDAPEQGIWWTPLFSDSPPEAALRDPAPWEDDFERADGPLGPNWVLGPGSGFDDDVHPMQIISGGAEGTARDTDPSIAPFTANMMHWAEAQGAAQIIEIEVERFASTGGYVQLFTNIAGGDKSSTMADFQYSPPSITITVIHFDADGAGTSLGSVTVSHPGGDPVLLRLETDADGTIRVYVDDVLALTAVDPTPVVGTFVGFGTQYAVTGQTISTRILRAAGHSLGGIVRKCSWVAGYRKSANIDYVDFSEVNAGPDDIQSSQAVAVMESGEDFGFTWKTLNYYLNAPETGGTIPPMSHTVSIRPERTSMVLVYVAVFKSEPVGITVTSDKLTFTNVLWQPQNSLGGWAQGGIWQTKLAGFPIDAAAPPQITVTWDTPIEKIEFIVYEVTNADSIHSQGAIVGGDHTTGSAAGALSMTLSATPVTSSVCIAFLGVSTPTYDETAGALIGAGWYEEIEVTQSGAAGFFQVQTRSGAADPTVTWADVDESDTGRDAVALAVEVVPSYNFLQWSTLDPLMIGGSRDGYSQPIYSVAGSNEDGTPVWGLDPSGPHLEEAT